MLAAGNGDLHVERDRDKQQWVLDWVLKETGREQNFEYDSTRRFPAEVKNYRMIPRVLYRHGRHKEAIADAARERGHAETAIALYHQAVEEYRHGQHAIFVEGDGEKAYLYAALERCYDHIVELSNGRIQRVSVPWEHSRLEALLHLAPVDGPAPTVMFCPGMDMTKEAFPHPLQNPFAARGMHVLSIDGPGQGASNVRGLHVTADNYERAGGRFLDEIQGRPEVDADRLAAAGFSMGSFWAMRLASFDDRLKAVASAAACYGSKRPIFQYASPRFKQVFMHMAGLHDEAAFDELAARLTLYEAAPNVTCPTLQVVGEYDPLCYLEDALEVYEAIAGPKEIWVLEDDFHVPLGIDNLGGLDIYPFLADWLRDVLGDGLPTDHDRRVLVTKSSGDGPYNPPVAGFTLPHRGNGPPDGHSEGGARPARA